MDIKDLDKKTVLVIGTGKTGIASALFLQDKAKKVLLSEKQKEPDNFKAEIQQLIKNNVEVEFEKNSDDFIKRSDLVIISPGINPFSDLVKKINSFNIPIISDIELASYFIKKPIIAITGTNGKTTTTSLITHLLNTSGKKAIACGNIGKPLIKMINQNVDFYVLEISSFQIFYSPTISPEIAICLNITSDHLDWHGSFEHYLETKKRLFMQQNINSWSVLNIGDNLIKNFKPKNNVFYFSPYKNDISLHKNCLNFTFFENNILKVKQNTEIQDIINKDELKIIGVHNIENALAGISVAKILNIKNEIIKEGLKTFQGVEHRLEFVKQINGKEFYNDSKATNPEATLKAIEAIGEKKGKKITLILGGRDKKTELKNMVRVINNQVNEVILFGEAKDRFQKELDNNGYNKELIIVKDLNEAVSISLKSKTDVVLFSPACSSFDMFKNYEERGKSFKELVSKL